MCLVELGSRRRLGAALARWFVFVWVGLFGMAEWGNAAGGPSETTVVGASIRRALTGRDEEAAATISTSESEDEPAGEEPPRPTGGQGQPPQAGYPAPGWLSGSDGVSFAAAGSSDGGQGERRRCGRATPARGPPTA